MKDLKILFPFGPMHLNIMATLILSSDLDFSAAVRNSSNSLNLVHWLDKSAPSCIVNRKESFTSYIDTGLVTK